MPPSPKKETVPDTIPLYDANYALVDHSNGGPYLDDERARQQEERNARVEGRKPDLSPENLATIAHPGRVLVTAEQFNNIRREASSGVNSVDDVEPFAYVPNPAIARAEQEKAELVAVQKRATVGNEAPISKKSTPAPKKAAAPKKAVVAKNTPKDSSPDLFEATKD